MAAIPAYETFKRDLTVLVSILFKFSDAKESKQWNTLYSVTKKLFPKSKNPKRDEMYLKRVFSRLAFEGLMIKKGYNDVVYFIPNYDRIVIGENSLMIPYNGFTIFVSQEEVKKILNKNIREG